MAKIIPYLKGIITLNLSQNQLTERTLDILIENRSSLESIKSVILSQNKINERKAKLKIDKLKSLDVVVSIWFIKLSCIVLYYNINCMRESR